MSDAALHTVADQLDDNELRATIQHRVEAARTSFYWAMRLLPRERRDGMYAVYAFCREVDDIADGERLVEQKLAALAGWRDEIAALYRGRPRHLVARALHDPTRRYGLRRDDFLAVIDGMEMDSREEIRAPNLATLDLYCARVASAVGHLSVHVFGDSSAAAHSVADSLGRALQLTNILRDLDEDAAMSRLYLPREALRDSGIISTDPRTVLAHPLIEPPCNLLVALAIGEFEAANAIMAQAPRRTIRAPRIMAQAYRLILDRLIARGFDPPRAPVRLPRAKIILIVLRNFI